MIGNMTLTESNTKMRVWALHWMSAKQVEEPITQGSGLAFSLWRLATFLHGYVFLGLIHFFFWFVCLSVCPTTWRGDFTKRVFGEKNSNERMGGTVHCYLACHNPSEAFLEEFFFSSLA